LQQAGNRYIAGQLQAIISKEILTPGKNVA